MLAKTDQQKVLLGIKEAVSEEKIWAALGDRWRPAIAAFNLVDCSLGSRYSTQLLLTVAAIHLCSFSLSSEKFARAVSN